MDSVTGEKSDNQVTFSGEPAIDSGDNLSFQTLFLCPTARIKSASQKSGDRYERGHRGLPYLELDSSPHFHGLAQKKNDIYSHHVLPQFCFNNKYYDCGACQIPEEFGKDSYICKKCSHRYHKECVESPFEIKHPYHPKHSLKLIVFELSFLVDCVHCGENSSYMIYNCALCNIYMHPVCAMKPNSFVLDQPKRHDHPLTLFTRRVSLDCNVCGMTSEVHPTYVCFKCNFIAHRDCAYSPGVIRISRHNHRISFVLSFPPRKWSCGVCSKNIDSEYGGYTCYKCNDYAVHSRCALRKDVWDEEDLEGVPEEEDIEEHVEPFKIISEGIILHFCHEHPLRVETSKVYDESKICQACIIPIYEGDFYSCIECDFILHDTCKNAPRRKQHALHSHSLALKVINGLNDEGYFQCSACVSDCCGFIYQCDKRSCLFQLDVRCASISEPFHYQGHEHPLFLALSPGEARKCHACKINQSVGESLNCIEKCDFIICFECVTVPYMVRYKHDKHFLTLGFEDDETSKPYWCEICEEESPSVREKRLYMCNHCCTTLHVDCLLGKHRNMKSGLTMMVDDEFKVQLLPNYNLSRPICDYCNRRCGDKIFFKTHDKIYCSMEEFD